MKKVVKMFYDLETTGTNVKRHGIHQISGSIEVDGIIKEEFNYFVKPNPKCEIVPAAIAVSNTTLEDLESYPEMGVVYKDFLRMLGKYINRYDRTEKAWLVGFNSAKFDDIFLRAWFEQNGDTYFGSWFWSHGLDVMVLAGQYLINERPSMNSFKLKRVAKELGIIVDESQLHNAAYDIELTRQIYYIVSGLDI